MPGRRPYQRCGGSVEADGADPLDPAPHCSGCAWRTSPSKRPSRSWTASRCAEARGPGDVQHVPRAVRRACGDRQRARRRAAHVATTRARVREAWEARKQIGPVVGDDLRRLAHLRNEAARAIGFADYWHVAATARRARSRTACSRPSTRSKPPPRSAVHGDEGRSRSASRRALRRRRSATCGPGTTRDPFFQETPEVFAPAGGPAVRRARRGRAGGREAIASLASRNIDAILRPQRPVPARRQEPARVRGRHRSRGRRAHVSQRRARTRAGWARCCTSSATPSTWTASIGTELPYDLRDDPQGFLNEGFAMFCEQLTTEPGLAQRHRRSASTPRPTGSRRSSPRRTPPRCWPSCAGA